MLSYLAAMRAHARGGSAFDNDRRLSRSLLLHDAAFLFAGLLALAAWDGAGLDLPISRLFADAGGFALRDHWLVGGVLHNGARWLAWVVGLVLLVGIWRPLPFARDLSRSERAGWLAMTLACVALIPVLKQLSLTSCPWSLAEFGGPATYVSHWLVGQADGGPGKCFPAGHATAAFCFLPGYFVLRRTAPRAARRWLLATLALGAVLTMVQVMRGAHFVSHSLWTAWWCWALAVGTRQAVGWLKGGRVTEVSMRPGEAGRAP